MQENLQDPGKRLEVVAAYQEAGLGRQRYGVSCPNPNCHKRISPQGYEFAMTNQPHYCLCPEQYGAGHESIYEILVEHGIDPGIGHMLNVRTNMHEATDKNKKKKRKKKKKNTSVNTGIKASDMVAKEPLGKTFMQLLAERSNNDR